MEDAGAVPLVTYYFREFKVGPQVTYGARCVRDEAHPQKWWTADETTFSFEATAIYCILHTTYYILYYMPCTMY